MSHQPDSAEDRRAIKTRPLTRSDILSFRTINVMGVGLVLVVYHESRNSAGDSAMVLTPSESSGYPLKPLPLLRESSTAEESCFSDDDDHLEALV